MSGAREDFREILTLVRPGARVLDAYEWGLSENNRRARYYRLTPAGRRQLTHEEAAWRRYAEAVFRVLEPAT